MTSASRPGGGIHANLAANNLLAVSARLDGRQNSRFGASCYSGFQIASSGTEYEYSNTGSLTNSTVWLDSGAAADVWVMWTRTSGNLSDWNSLGSGNNNVRLQCSTTRSFRCIDTTGSGFPSGEVNIYGYCRFYDAASGGNLLQTTSTVEWAAWYEDAGPCPLCCFTPDTLVTMARGIQVPIASIRKGDEIIVVDPATHEVRVEPVTGIITRRNRTMYRIHFEDGTYINASDDHPFDVKGEPRSINPIMEYKDLGLPAVLTVGNMVTKSSGLCLRITKIELIDYPGEVYTLANSGFVANDLLVY